MLENKKESLPLLFYRFPKSFRLCQSGLALLIQIGIDGRFYDSIKAIYNNPISCVQVTDWFQTPYGVKQGDVLSPTLFAIFINNLAKEVKEVNVGVNVGDLKVCMLLYADNIVLISENELDLQTMLNVVHAWCNKMRLKIIVIKPKLFISGVRVSH